MKQKIEYIEYRYFCSNIDGSKPSEYSFEMLEQAIDFCNSWNDDYEIIEENAQIEFDFEE